MTNAQTCEDLVDFCDTLQPVCFGSVIKYQLQQLKILTDQLSNSPSLPTLESFVMRSNGSGFLPYVGADINVTESNQFEQNLKDSLPLLEETIPLLRESLPLIRESLPLLRHIIDMPYYNIDKTTGQKKSTYKKVTKMTKTLLLGASKMQFTDHFGEMVRMCAGCPPRLQRCPTSLDMSDP
ncbi:hypothetical protein Y032_0001g419 [Ancylostoma ceylanicum]|nr:hypothetical protein Y032_0001g419 [Ancylostoma ceylanicum]